MLGLMRVYLSKDISLLGYPGFRLWWAHVNYIACYGWSDYKKTKKWSKERHMKWQKEGRQISLRRNYKAKMYVGVK